MPDKLIVEPEKCIGCLLCQFACSKDSGKYRGEQLSKMRIWENEEAGIRKQLVCIQCDEHYCVEACSVDAIIFNSELNIYFVKQDECIGCGQCVDACPHDGVFMGPEYALKCDLCGGSPRCAEACVPGAIMWFGNE